MTFQLAIVGAGISGSAAALEARARGLERVLIADYEGKPGGLLQGAFAGGGFEEEAETVLRASLLPYEIRYRTTAVGLFFDEDRMTHLITFQGPEGTFDVEAERVLLCSGSLEKPREARRIPGGRPAGVMTPLMAVGLLERGYVPGRRALLAGDGRIANSAAKLLRESGMQIDSLPEAWELAGVRGVERVTGVDVRHRATGEARRIDCDTLLFSQGRIPCTFYLKGGAIERDERHAIVVDGAGRTNLPRVSAAGSCTTAGDDDHRLSAAGGRNAVAALLEV